MITAMKSKAKNKPYAIVTKYLDRRRISSLAVGSVLLKAPKAPRKCLKYGNST